jgi:hypothetical protein
MISLHKTWVITKSLLLSQLRATAVGTTSRIGVRSPLRRPLILGIIDVVGFAAAAGIAYYLGSLIAMSATPSQVSFLSGDVRNFIIILPAVILTIILVLGLVLEVSAGAQFASSDTVNWLPVTASEYVAASTLSLLIYYSIFPVVVLGATLSLAYVFGVLGAWELAAVLSIFGIVTSTSILEIARAVLNRFSTSLYRRGGRAAIALRALFGVIVIVLFQALFYPTVYEHFLGVITPSFGPTWFVPLLWASVAVTALLSANLLVSMLFSLLAIGFAVVLFFSAVAARSRYWVPMQPSVRISSSAYAPKRGVASIILNQSQLAITKKDLRGLVRRREMVRLLALPAVFLVVAFLSSSTSSGFSLSTYLGTFIVAYTALYFSMSSVGAEGKSIINLYQAPVVTKDFVIGKAVPPIIFGSSFGIAFYIIAALITSRAFAVVAPLFLVLSVGLAFEMSLVGLLFGMRFPNFSESPRAAFVSQTAGLIALPSAVLIGGISLSPILITSMFNLGYSAIAEGFVASIVVIGFVCYLSYRFALIQADKLLSQIPI